MEETANQKSTWNGEFFFGDFWAAFRGETGDNSLHAHATLQIVIAHTGKTHVEDAAGVQHSHDALVIRPGVPHALKPIDNVTLIFVEPQSRHARAFLGRTERPDISRLPEHLATQLGSDVPLPAYTESLLPPPSPQDEGLDPRLARAISLLDRPAGTTTIGRAACDCGLSEARLRALASEQLGVPLSKWVTWRRLRRAAMAIAAGDDLASAAIAGGFTDQAHFSRTMRNVIGVTPSTAISPLR
jgi:AraC-like DNA-binding protein